MIFFVINGDFDMTIIDRASDHKIPAGLIYSFMGRFIGGERTLWRRDFLDADIKKSAGWGLEQLLNLYFVNSQKKVRTIYCDNIESVYQFEKQGVKKGLKEYTKFFKEIYSKTDFKGFFLQVGNIEEDRLEPLYKIYNRVDQKAKAIPMILIIIGGLILSIISFFFLNTKGIGNKLRQNIKKHE
jgi:hypothetical protein